VERIDASAPGAPIEPGAGGPVSGAVVPASDAGALEVPPLTPGGSPMESLCALVGWATALFFWAEQGENPSVQTWWDAFHYIATSLSVGYANIFPVTPLGKMIGGVVMMLGPAMSSRALDREPEQSSQPSRGRTPSAEDAVVAKLDEILIELRRAR
jgi:hypothetical protein